MMDLHSYDEVEDGEISDSSDDYTPLQRPSTLTAVAAGPLHNNNSTIGSALVTPEACNPTLSPTSPLATGLVQMQRALEEDSQPESSSESSSGESSDACLKKASTKGVSSDGQSLKGKRRKRIKRTVMVRVQPTVDTEAAQEKRARFKKYNIWTAALQEEALTENMRGCDVTKGGFNDRNVENYDFSLKYRLNGENSLKRRLSNSTDDFSDGSEMHPNPKRRRPSTSRDDDDSSQRRSVKSRLGHRSGGGGSNRRGSSATSGSDSYEPRHILDLNDVVGRDPLDIAREIANKLYEEKDELLVRVVEVIGTELPVEIYKETQRIEADGGMMIKNGKRRRTPGGVFLFLLKNHDRVTAADQKSIFIQERQESNKWHKKKKSKSRDRKVEELKKRLSEQEKELPALSTRKDHFLLGSDLTLENQAANLSNPPPSPVGHEHSPEYKAHAINHVATDANPLDKPSTSASAALAALPSSRSAAKDVEFEDCIDDFTGGIDMDFF